MNTESLQPVNVYPSQPRGFAFWATVAFIFLVVLPTMCVEKAVHKAETVIAEFDLRENDIEFVAIEERYAYLVSQSDTDGLSAVACLGHLAPEPLAVVDGQSLYAVEPNYRAPDPWPTPRYVWVRRYEDGDVAYRAVYAVFRSRKQVEEWTKDNGYEGHFQFSLAFVVKERKADQPYAIVNSPCYRKGHSTLQFVIFTLGAKYAVTDEQARPSGPDDEMYSLYRRLAR